MSARDTRATPAASSATASTQDVKIAPILIGLMLAMLLAALNQTVLAPAVPTIVGELNGVSQLVWVMTAYILASTITMPVYGKLGDQIGRKNLLIAAILIFMAGSVVGGLATDMSLFIAARAIQGIGGGGLMILSQAAIADVVPARERGKYMGIMGGVFALASVAGPLLGGWFTEGPGWRWAFWINLPVGALALLAALGFLKLPKVRGKATLDWGGMALMTVATTSLILATTWGGNTHAWSDPLILGLIAATVLAAVGFVLVERRTAAPIIPMHLFRERNFTLTTVAGLLTGVAMFGVLGYMPTYLQMAFGVDATASGLLMVPMMAMLVLTSTVSGHLVSAFGHYKSYPVVGSVLIAVSLWLLSTMTPATPVWLICVYLSVLGFGLGCSMQILVLIVQNTFPLREVGTATAANNYFRQIGATLGSSLVGNLFAVRLVELLTDRLSTEELARMGSPESLTPEVLAGLPGSIQDPVVASYSDALTPIYLWIAPLALIAAILLLFVSEKPLATALERSVDAEEGDEGMGPGATGSVVGVAPGASEESEGSGEHDAVTKTPHGRHRISWSVHR